MFERRRVGKHRQTGQPKAVDPVRTHVLKRRVELRRHAEAHGGGDVAAAYDVSANEHRDLPLAILRTLARSGQSNAHRHTVTATPPQTPPHEHYHKHKHQHRHQHHTFHLPIIRRSRLDLPCTSGRRQDRSCSDPNTRLRLFEKLRNTDYHTPPPPNAASARRTCCVEPPSPSWAPTRQRTLSHSSAMRSVSRQLKVPASRTNTDEITPTPVSNTT